MQRENLFFAVGLVGREKMLLLRMKEGRAPGWGAPQAVMGWRF
jgi:hypothetical protein